MLLKVLFRLLNSLEPVKVTSLKSHHFDQNHFSAASLGAQPFTEPEEEKLLEVFRCASISRTSEGSSCRRALCLSLTGLNGLRNHPPNLGQITSETTFGHSKLFCLPFLCLHILERKKLQKLEDALVEQLLASDYC